MSQLTYLFTLKDNYTICESAVCSLHLAHVLVRFYFINRQISLLYCHEQVQFALKAPILQSYKCNNVHYCYQCITYRTIEQINNFLVYIQQQLYFSPAKWTENASQPSGFPCLTQCFFLCTAISVPSHKHFATILFHCKLFRRLIILNISL